jgi:hypothetical protein
VASGIDMVDGGGRGARLGRTVFRRDIFWFSIAGTEREGEANKRATM